MPSKPKTTAKAPRRATIKRKTKEVDVTVTLSLDGTGAASAKTGLPFFDHMLEQLGKHAGFDLQVRAKGDLEVDAHHTVEDTGIAVGEAVLEALGDKKGIARFGSAHVPLDEALIHVALDLSARPFLVHEVDAKAKLIGAYDTRLTEEFMRAFAQAAGATVHVRMISGRNPHHIVEAEFKAFARALGDACRPTGRSGVPSTKGKL
ncbi:MAG TPA: imidazoleglycerol-phosphate dehydratase HisB [Actinomycetota bacterium]|nr:imidazoleglycerol-phosphate dehydratase HisB [Actinomycetota bacterium]